MHRREITVNSRKYDQEIRRTWQCELIEQNDSLIVLVGEFDHDVEHTSLGSIRKGTISYEYFWFDRWYNIFRFHEPDGTLRNYYCNVTMPPTLEDGVLDYVDLDIDIIIWPDFGFDVVDQVDFVTNALKYDYPEEIHKKTGDSITEVLSLIDRGKLPT
ncbi:MAG: DUF402 domain-containing protein [Chloracidobacterium sp.]|nr:DUF402 domain-containing protein [Chloracidobacterium sp.]